MNPANQSSPYTIYLFEKSSDHRTPAWRRHRSVETLEEARREMKALYETGNYQQIEIKKQGYSKRRRRAVTTTLIVMNDRKGAVHSLVRSFLPSRG